LSTEKSDTTGFSHVVFNFNLPPSLRLHLQIPLALAAWSFNFTLHLYPERNIPGGYRRCAWSAKLGRNWIPRGWSQWCRRDIGTVL